MPVGTGSIKRAAKANANATAGTKAAPAPEKKVQETVVKKTTTTKKAAPKKTTVKKEKAPVQNSYNQVCHLTEELPIHLL